MGERYEIKGRLGRGGIGAVYLAYDHHLKREVAIKRLLPREETRLNESAAASLEGEARALASLSHPNIVTIFEFGKDEKGPFVVFEYIEGDTLKTVIGEGALMEGDFYEVADQILDALVAAHEINILHRDIKPANIMLSWLPSGKFRIKILDFGLAKLSHRPSKQTLDQKGSFLGSVDYVAPEQIELGQLDRRTDLYSLGCVLYFALTQRAPFAGGTLAETMTHHLEGKVVPLGDMRPDLPAPLCHWVMRLISRNPSDRPADALIALQELEKAKEEARHTVILPEEYAKLVVPLVESAHPTNHPVRLEHTQQIVSSPPLVTESPIPALPPRIEQVTSQKGQRGRFPAFWLAMAMAGLLVAFLLGNIWPRTEPHRFVTMDQKWKNSSPNPLIGNVSESKDLVAYFSVCGAFLDSEGDRFQSGEALQKPAAWENLAPAAHPFHLLLSPEDDVRKPSLIRSSDGQTAILCRPGSKWFSAPEAFRRETVSSDQFTVALLYRFDGKGRGTLFRMTLKDRAGHSHLRAIQLSFRPGALLLESAVSDEMATGKTPEGSENRLLLTFLEQSGESVRMWQYFEDPRQGKLTGGESVSVPLLFPASLESYEAGNLIIEKNASEETHVELLALTIHRALLNETEKRRLAMALFEEANPIK